MMMMMMIFWFLCSFETSEMRCVGFCGQFWNQWSKMCWFLCRFLKPVKWDVFVFCAEAKKLFQAPEAPKTVLEALTQRLEKYKSSQDSARQGGDSGKARRMGRIVKVAVAFPSFFSLSVFLYSFGCCASLQGFCAYLVSAFPARSTSFSQNVLQIFNGGMCFNPLTSRTNCNFWQIMGCFRIIIINN